MGNTWYKNKPWAFNNKRLSYIKSLTDKISNHSIHKKALNEILHDFISHLETPCGTFDNYSGKYGKNIIELVKEHYPEIISDDLINSYVNKKVLHLYNHFYQNALNNKYITINSEILKMLTKYINSDKNQDSNFILSIPFIEANNGQKTKPDPRA
jgi:hypothetical protein